MVSKPIINSLPTELLFNVLSYLCTYDLLHNVALVSKKFNDASKSPRIHKVVTLQFVCSKALHSLRKAIFMTELHINYSDSDTVDKDKDMPKLCWEYLNSSEIDIDLILTAVSNHPHLKAFLVYKPTFITDETLELFRETKWWRNLTKFHLFIEDFSKDLENSDEEEDRDDLDLQLTISELSFNVQMNHFGLGIEPASVGNFEISEKLKQPMFENLKSLTCYFFILYGEDEAIKMVMPVKDILEELTITQIKTFEDLNCDFISLIPNLRVLKANVCFSGLNALPRLGCLTDLKIMRLAEQDLTTNAVLLDPGCMPTVKYLYKGSPDFDYIHSYGMEIEEELNCKMVPPIQVTKQEMCPRHSQPAK